MRADCAGAHLFHLAATAGFSDTVTVSQYVPTLCVHGPNTAVLQAH